MQLISVEGLDRALQPAFGILSGVLRQRIIDRFRPAIFLERRQDSFLVRCRRSESLHHFAAEAEFATIGVPFGFRIVERGHRRGEVWVRFGCDWEIRGRSRGVLVGGTPLTPALSRGEREYRQRLSGGGP